MAGPNKPPKGGVQKHPRQMCEPPQLAPFDAKELYPDVRAPHPNSKTEHASGMSFFRSLPSDP